MLPVPLPLPEPELLRTEVRPNCLSPEPPVQAIPIRELLLVLAEPLELPGLPNRWSLLQEHPNLVLQVVLCFDLFWPSVFLRSAHPNDCQPVKPARPLVVVLARVLELVCHTDPEPSR